MEGTQEQGNDQATSQEGNQSQENNQATQNSLGWRAGLPKDLQGNEKFSGFKTVGDFAKAFLEREEEIGKRVLIPGDGASEEEKRAYKTALGIPASADGYKFEGVLPEAMKPQEFDAWLRNLAYENDMTPAEAQVIRDVLANQYRERVKQEADARKEQERKSEETLREEYGQDYDKNVRLAHRVAALGGEDFMTHLDETGLGNDPRLVRAFVKFGNLVAEDVLVTGTVSGASKPKSKGVGVVYGDWMEEEFGAAG